MVEHQIKKANEYLKKQLWMDFELCCMNRGKVELYGFLDEAEDEKIKIVFNHPFMILCNFFFTYEGSGVLMDTVIGEEAFSINKKYSVTQGNQIFRITNTNVNSDMFIIAKDVEVQIIE